MDNLKERARKLGLRGLVADWESYADQSWVAEYIAAEEQERQRRSLERRLKEAHIGQFKPMSDFDWTWPDTINREQVEDLLTLEFMKEQANVVLVGTNGLGKTMIAQNLASIALGRGYSTKFVTASQMLNQLHDCDSPSARRRCLKRFSSPDLLVIDEVGYLS